MTEDGSDLVLDGNAAAGLLQEIFVLDITTAQIRCEACGSTGAVGSLRLYAAPMGASSLRTGDGRESGPSKTSMMIMRPPQQGLGGSSRLYPPGPLPPYSRWVSPQ